MAQKNEKDKSERINVGRRAFLKTAGVAPLAAGVVGGVAELEAQTVARGRSGRSADYAHGQRQAVDPERRTARDAAQRDPQQGRHHRQQARLRSRRLRRLHDDHRRQTAYSCSTLAIEAQGKQIRTVDGLANGATLHPVQQAFCDRDALMCGFCTPGFVMATVALIEK